MRQLLGLAQPAGPPPQEAALNEWPEAFSAALLGNLELVRDLARKDPQLRSRTLQVRSQWPGPEHGPDDATMPLSVLGAAVLGALLEGNARRGGLLQPDPDRPRSRFLDRPGWEAQEAVARFLVGELGADPRHAVPLDRVWASGMPRLARLFALDFDAPPAAGSQAARALSEYACPRVLLRLAPGLPPDSEPWGIAERAMLRAARRDNRAELGEAAQRLGHLPFDFCWCLVQTSVQWCGADNLEYVHGLVVARLPTFVPPGAVDRVAVTRAAPDALWLYLTKLWPGQAAALLPLLVPTVAAAHPRAAEVVPVALRLGADPNARNLGRDTALHAAVQRAKGAAATTRALLVGGANPLLRDGACKTPAELPTANPDALEVLREWAAGQRARRALERALDRAADMRPYDLVALCGAFLHESSSPGPAWAERVAESAEASAGAAASLSQRLVSCLARGEIGVARLQPVPLGPDGQERSWRSRLDGL